MVKRNKVSNAVIRRLPRYYRYLTELREQNVERISSIAFGNLMGLTASQIRQDLACFGEFGQQGYGYNVEKLREEIGKILGINRSHTIIIIGAGNLGRALLQNFHFDKSGITVTAVFDVDPELIGTEINGVKVRHIDEMCEYITANSTEIAVLTVPQQYAISTARQITDAGIHGIWNFTNIELKLDKENVIVENVHFADSLLSLNYRVSDKMDQAEN